MRKSLDLKAGVDVNQNETGPVPEGAYGLDHPIRFAEVRLEMTNSCSYRCIMCPREQMTRKKGTMSVADLALVLNRVGNHEGPIYLHGFGEALLDSKLPEKVSLISAYMPRARIGLYSTLGTPAGHDYFSQLVNAGLREIHVSIYGYSRETYRQVHGIDRYELARANLIELAKAQCAYSGKLAVHILCMEGGENRIHCAENSKNESEKFTAWLNSLGMTSIRAIKMHNFGRGRRYNRVQTNTPCSIAWGTYRRFLQVSWNLNVIPCCFYFDDDVVFGNLCAQTLREIFTGEPYLRFIRSHWDNDLGNYPVCANCERDLSGDLHEKEKVGILINECKGL